MCVLHDVNGFCGSMQVNLLERILKPIWVPPLQVSIQQLVPSKRLRTAETYHWWFFHFAVVVCASSGSFHNGTYSAPSMALPFRSYHLATPKQDTPMNDARICCARFSVLFHWVLSENRGLESRVFAV